MQAVGLTFGTLFVMLLAYRSGLIPVTAKLRMGIIAATGGIALLYVLEMLLGFFGIQFVSINGTGFIGIAFSLFSNRAAANLHKGEYDKAIADCTAAIVLDPKYADAYYGRASSAEERREGQSGRRLRNGQEARVQSEVGLVTLLG